jgi:hypothetical protein
MQASSTLLPIRLIACIIAAHNVARWFSILQPEGALPMARATATDQAGQPQSRGLATITDIHDANRKVTQSIGVTVRRRFDKVIDRLTSENTRLHEEILNLETKLATLHAEQLVQERRQGRSQLILGVVFTLVGAVIGWLLGALGNPAQAFSIIFPLHR